MSEDHEMSPEGVHHLSYSTACVRRFFDRHRVPARDRIAILERVLNVPYQKARRRYADESPWSIEQLRDLAAHYDETVGDICDDIPASYVAAVLQIGGVTEAVDALLGDEPAVRDDDALVALKGDRGIYRIVPGAECKGVAAYEVRRLLKRAAAHRKRLAVLDDDADVADSVAQYMTAQGYDVTPFNSLEALDAAIRQSPYDGYILDWLIGRKPALDLIRAIREDWPDVPILVLTGQMAGGKVSENVLLDACLTLRFDYWTKPLDRLSQLIPYFASRQRQ